jgi:tetratricopeptide (TPR) repeat protein
VIERLLAAESALARDELDAAERQFSLVADADPRNAIAVVGLARIAARRDDPDGARTLAQRALEIDPDEAAAARLLTELDRSVGVAKEASPVPAASPRAPWWRRWIDRLRRRG